MADIVDKDTRSRMMSGIRGKNTKPEMRVRSLLHRMGFRFRLHVRDLPGRPDIVLPRYHAVIFVHGCFWHGHACPSFRFPQTREEFWRDKIETNRMNDRQAKDLLLAAGWRVAVVWECSLGRSAKNGINIPGILSEWLKGSEKTVEISPSKGA